MTNFIKEPEDLTDGVYIYGMRLRGFSPGAQPDGVFFWGDDEVTRKYYNLLYYGRPLTEKETKDYELDFLHHIPQNKLNDMRKTVNLIALCNLMGSNTYQSIEDFTSAVIRAANE